MGAQTNSAFWDGVLMRPVVVRDLLFVPLSLLHFLLPGAPALGTCFPRPGHQVFGARGSHVHKELPWQNRLAPKAMTCLLSCAWRRAGNPPAWLGQGTFAICTQHGRML